MRAVWWPWPPLIGERPLVLLVALPVGVAAPLSLRTVGDVVGGGGGLLRSSVLMVTAQPLRAGGGVRLRHSAAGLFVAPLAPSRASLRGLTSPEAAASSLPPLLLGTKTPEKSFTDAASTLCPSGPAPTRRGLLPCMGGSKPRRLLMRHDAVAADPARDVGVVAGEASRWLHVAVLAARLAVAAAAAAATASVILFIARLREKASDHLEVDAPLAMPPVSAECDSAAAAALPPLSTPPLPPPRVSRSRC